MLVPWVEMEHIADPKSLQLYHATEKETPHITLIPSFLESLLIDKKSCSL